MLDTETKRRIDTARDILVGKVPDPKSQVEQITIALIYKFMDDMDREAISFGGKASFFTGEYKKYSWTKIFDTKVGGHEMLSLYGEAIVKLNLNPNIPQLFRDIFKNAYLPYRDPETLKLFLKTINEFHYDHSEMLGDAFEYLLSVLGSQGDAGQFRTPRHIIDFIVEILQPKKNETILDPACGTAGFLISSYKHILQNNTKKNKGDLLTPDNRKKMMQNIVGYDISPDMVRLSLVNLYLHGFTTPMIYEYDTLTSEDRWNEYYDIILANPPFMSPKGGIKPHKKFTVQANRSEVLFVDYIAEHIHPSTGRAGIIVPEGIIFQSATAYKALRKMLVENNLLYAVVSLPAGIFQPYSGVKTSILLIDKTLAKKTDNILFVKIDNDGFDLGAQRRANDKNDLTGCLELLQKYKIALQENTTFESDNKNVFLVEKKIIGVTDDFNLSIDRFRVNENVQQSNYEMVRLGDVCKTEYGYTESAQNFGDTRIIRITDIKHDGTLKNDGAKFINLNDEAKNSILKVGDLVVARTGATFGKTLFFNENYQAVFASFLIRLNFDTSKVLPKYYWCFTKTDKYWEQANALMTGGGQPQFNANAIVQIEFPLPPLSIQQQIVTKIESYQKIIDGAKQIVENYKPQIDIDPGWEMVKLGESGIEIIDGDRGVNYPKKEDFSENGYCVFLSTTNVRKQGFVFSDIEFITKKKDEALRKGKLKRNDIVLTTRGTVGNVGIYNSKVKFDQIRINSGMVIFRVNEKKFYSEYIFQLIQSDYFQYQIKQIISGSAQPQLPIRNMIEIEIPLPPISIQQEIVTRIEEEQALVNSNKKLIGIFEQKIKDEINKLWQVGPKEYAMPEEKLSITEV